MGISVIEYKKLKDLQKEGYKYLVGRDDKEPTLIAELIEEYESEDAPTALEFTPEPTEDEEFNEFKFSGITYEMNKLYIQKNTDYGKSFDKSLDEDGLLVSKIRLGDKYNRFARLIKHESEVKDESIEDTLIDLANYAVMTILWMRRNEK